MKKTKMLLISLISFLIMPLFITASDDWQTDWTYSTNNTAKTITLTKYKGTETDYTIPAKATINGEEYSVILGNGSNSSNKPLAGTIKNLKVEEGVKINNLNYLFYQATNLESVDLTGADTSGATSVQGMFYGATNLKKVNLSGLDMSKVTNVRYMFYQATNIEEIDFSNTDMSKITTFAYSSPNNSYASAPYMGMTKLKKINMKNFNTASLTTAERMFMIQVGSYDNQNHIEEIDVTNWNIENVTSFYETFAYCGINNDITITGLDTLDTSKIKNFSGTFMSTEKAKDLTGVENWDVSSATNFHSMFSGSKSITKLNLSSWNTSNVTDMGSMFVSCHSLSDLNVSTWDTSKVKAMDTIFKGCASLEVLNLKNWTSESVENKAGSHMLEMLGAQKPNGEYPLTPLKEITLNDNFEFSLFGAPGLRSGYWHLKEGTDQETSKKFTPGRLYNSYNNGTTPPDGYNYNHTYVLTQLDPASAQYYAHGWGDNNTWEVHYPDDRFKAYCINLHRSSPSGYYDRTLVNANSIIDDGFLDSDNYGWGTLGSNMEEALITLIYFGYGNDAAKIQEKYGLSNSEYLLVTQQAIWDYTDRYNNIPERDRNTKSGQAYYELVSKKFSDIPNNENLKLYLYESIDGKQNLLSISGLNDVAYAGVRVLKLTDYPDGSLGPLIGAVFTIYDDNGNEVGTITTDENGYATKYNTDSLYGLAQGIYTIKETKVPRGYKKANSSDYYSFIVRSSDDNEIITNGKYKNAGDEVPMIFENTTDNTVTGGGVEIEKVDTKGNVLMGATFEIIDENNNVIQTLTTTEKGTVKTGNKDLQLNKEYTIKETKAPSGYILTTKEKKVTVTENMKYEKVTFENKSKKCNLTIKATKKYNKTLTKNQFKFELVDINDNVVKTSSNDKDGNIEFEMEYSADDLGYIVYKVREKKGNDKNITYDNSENEIVVYITDEGNDNLSCNVEGEVAFNNIYNDTFIPDPINSQNIDKHYTNMKTPKTGIETNTNYFVVLMVSFLLMYIVYEIVNRKIIINETI